MTGTAMAIGSAVAFGWLSVLAKLAYESGLAIYQLLAFRFVLAAAGMLAIALIARQSPFRVERRRLLALFLLGAAVYTGQALTYFTALRSLPASLCVLVVYVYPSLVVLAGWIFFRHRVSVWHAAALAGSFAGLVLLVGGAQLRLSPAIAFAVAASLIYTAYIIIGERVMTGVQALPANAVIMAGAALSFSALAATTGQLELPRTSGQWAASLAIAVVPTMIAISLFMAALPRIGGAKASLLSTLEPVVTVGVAAVLLGDRLTPVQAAGGVLVLGAVVLVQASQAWRPAATTPG